MQKNTSNKTAFTSEGYGRPLILIHGLGMNKDMWNFQVRAFAKSCLVITYDLLGHGQTIHQSKSYSMDMFVMQLSNFVNYLGINEFGLIGFSFGGIIAREYTSHYPNSVRALSIISSPYDRSQKERDDVMLRVNECAAGGPKATVEDAINRWFTNRPNIR